MGAPPAAQRRDVTTRQERISEITAHNSFWYVGKNEPASLPPFVQTGSHSQFSQSSIHFLAASASDASTFALDPTLIQTIPPRVEARVGLGEGHIA
jgi:hypothetical protein